MRKLSNVEKNIKTSLEGITNSCSCVAVCNPLYGQGSAADERMQRQYAHTGTMPEGVTQDI